MKKKSPTKLGFRLSTALDLDTDERPYRVAVTHSKEVGEVTVLTMTKAQIFEYLELSTVDMIELARPLKALRTSG